jgi:hypothetical protein
MYLGMYVPEILSIRLGYYAFIQITCKKWYLVLSYLHKKCIAFKSQSIPSHPVTFIDIHHE